MRGKSFFIGKSVVVVDSVLSLDLEVSCLLDIESDQFGCDLGSFSLLFCEESTIDQVVYQECCEYEG